MAEAVGLSRDEQVAQLVSAVLLAGSVLLFLLQLPDVAARTMEFSPWIYVPGLLAFFVGAWKRADAVVMLSVLWLGVFLMIDLYYGVSFFG